MENYRGSTLDDVVFGNSQNNDIQGGAGENTIDGRGGVNKIVTSDARGAFAQQFTTGAAALFDQLDHWADTLDVNMPVIGAAVDTAMASADIDALLNLPEFANISSMEDLQHQLAEAGFSIESLPSSDGGELRVNWAGQSQPIVGATEFDDATLTLLSDIPSVANFNGQIQWSGVVGADLTFGVDDEGFYLLGESSITLNITAEGDIASEYNLPLGVSVMAGGAAGVEAAVSLTGEDAAEKYRSEILNDVAAFTRLAKSGEAEVSLDFTLRPLDLKFSGDWTLPMDAENANQVQGDIRWPSQDDMLNAVVETMGESVSDVFGQNAWLQTLREVELPLIGDEGATTSATEDAVFNGLHVPNFFQDFETYWEQTGDTVHTAGDAWTDANDLRDDHSLTGQGIKIGVVSNGIKGAKLSAQAGELPHKEVNGVVTHNITVNPNFGNHPVRNLGGEGTDMLEIIHDVAPGAELLFSSTHPKPGAPFSPSTRNSLHAFRDAITWLVQQGADIIVDDVTNTDSPFFQDGEIVDRIQKIVDHDPTFNPLRKDVLFVTSAGNHRERHYQGVGSPQTVSGVVKHTFTDAEGNNPQAFIGAKGTKGKVVLQWDDPWGARTKQFEVVMIDPATGNMVARSRLDPGANPRATLEIRPNLRRLTNPNAEFNLEIRPLSGTTLDANVTFEIMFISGTLNEQYRSQGDQIFSHAAMEEVNTADGRRDPVLTIGAVDMIDIPTKPPTGRNAPRFLQCVWAEHDEPTRCGNGNSQLVGSHGTCNSRGEWFRTA